MKSEFRSGWLLYLCCSSFDGTMVRDDLEGIASWAGTWRIEGAGIGASWLRSLFLMGWWVCRAGERGLGYCTRQGRGSLDGREGGEGNGREKQGIVNYALCFLVVCSIPSATITVRTASCTLSIYSTSN